MQTLLNGGKNKNATAAQDSVSH